MTCVHPQIPPPRPLPHTLSLISPAPSRGFANECQMCLYSFGNRSVHRQPIELNGNVLASVDLAVAVAGARHRYAPDPKCV